MAHNLLKVCSCIFYGTSIRGDHWTTPPSVVPVVWQDLPALSYGVNIDMFGSLQGYTTPGDNFFHRIFLKKRMCWLYVCAGWQRKHSRLGKWKISSRSVDSKFKFTQVLPSFSQELCGDSLCEKIALEQHVEICVAVASYTVETSTHRHIVAVCCSDVDNLSWNQHT